MPVVTNELFRVRVLEFQTQKAIDEALPRDYLIAALSSPEDNLEDVKRLVEALAKLCRVRSGERADRDSNRPGQRFINMVHRDDDVSHWVKFLKHEQQRQGSRWKEGAISALPKKLREWHSSLDAGTERDVVVRGVEEALQNVVANLTPEERVEERVHVGLRAFRALLWRLRSGGGEE